ncbi:MULTISPECIES: hypothetical protein [Henriciella]|uniref:hypothetical protein n=1 Tax=Henriciella TaxID=453849 RepID=UPI0035113FA4
MNAQLGFVAALAAMLFASTASADPRGCFSDSLAGGPAASSCQVSTDTHAGRYTQRQIASALKTSTLIRRVGEAAADDTRIIRAPAMDRPSISFGDVADEVSGVRVFRGGVEGPTRPCSFVSTDTGVTTHRACATRRPGQVISMNGGVPELAGGPGRAATGPAIYSLSHQPSVNFRPFSMGLRPKVITGPLRRY